MRSATNPQARRRRRRSQPRACVRSGRSIADRRQPEHAPLVGTSRRDTRGGLSRSGLCQLPTPCRETRTTKRSRRSLGAVPRSRTRTGRRRQPSRGSRDRSRARPATRSRTARRKQRRSPPPSSASLMWNERCTSGASTPYSPLSRMPTRNAAVVRSVTGAQPYFLRIVSIGGGLPSPCPGII